MAEYELIGKKLGHSFSKPIHEALGAYRYALRELPTEADVANYLQKKQFKGCNVTIPYKQTVMPYCDEIDQRAARIGAVNTIVNRNGRLYGYNTDYDGFAYMLARKGISLKGRRVLLLGSGATCKTASAVAADAGAAATDVASRTPAPGQIAYTDAEALGTAEILINVSPAGMYPNNGQSLVQPKEFAALTAVADMVYNPLKTSLLMQAEQLGLQTAGGLPMLVHQAVVAATLFTGHPFAKQETERILHMMLNRFANLTLVGMPSSGKTRLGREVAVLLHKKYVDLDEELVRRAQKSIPQIFEEEGEAGFRKRETEILAEFSKLQGQVLATGGGVVTQPQNLPLLRQNGVVVYIDRPLHQLQVGKGRPLSTNQDALAEMYARRHPLYKSSAHATVANNAPAGQVVQDIVEAYHAVLDT